MENPGKRGGIMEQPENRDEITDKPKIKDGTPEKAEKKDPLWVRIVAASVCVVITIGLEIVIGGLLFMLCTIIFRKTCEFLGMTVEVNSSVMAGLFGFFIGNAFFLPTLIIFRKGARVMKAEREKNPRA